METDTQNIPLTFGLGHKSFISFNENNDVQGNLKSSSCSSDVKNFCPHAPKVYVLMDRPKTDKFYQFMNQHIEECGICKSDSSFLKEAFNTVTEKIPLAQLDKSFQDEIQHEIRRWVFQEDIKKRQRCEKLLRIKTQKCIRDTKQFLLKSVNSDWSKYFLVSIFTVSLFKLLFE